MSIVTEISSEVKNFIIHRMKNFFPGSLADEDRVARTKVMRSIFKHSCHNRNEKRFAIDLFENSRARGGDE